MNSHWIQTRFCGPFSNSADEAGRDPPTLSSRFSERKKKVRTAMWAGNRYHLHSFHLEVP